MIQSANKSITDSSLFVGDVITVPLKSSGGTKLTITASGFTAEVNGAECEALGDGRYGRQKTRGSQVINISLRVPAAIGINKGGITHAIYFWQGSWIGAHHRSLQFSREWEDDAGDLLAPPIAQMVDQALANEP